MTQQISAHPDKKSISDLIGKIRREELILQPAFQRKFVWTKTHMEGFIETILKGLPFPEIYISQQGIDLDTLTAENVVVDGQQRLTTIQQYIDGSGNFEKNIPKYAMLSDEEKRNFLNYDVTVRDLKNASQKMIIEIFKRINSANFTLTKVEIHNAVYDGAFISCAKKIIDLIDDQDKKLLLADVFNASELTRMADLHFILLVLSRLEEGGYFADDNKVEEYIARYNEDYPNEEKNKVLLSKVIVGILNSGLKEDSIWFRKSNFFTMVVEFCCAEITEINTDILQRLNQLEENILRNKNENKDINEFASYYSRMYAGTNSRQSRITRSDIFKKYVITE